MFGYAPTENDQSGRIIAQGMMGAAQTNAETMNQMGQNIGAALMSIGSAYKEHEDMKAGVKSGEKLLEVMGPSFGMTADKLKEFDYSNMSLRDKFNFHQGWQGNFATMAQGYNFGRNLEQRADQPFVAADLQNRRNIASGNTTFTPGGGAPDPGPVLMDGAEADTPLPAVQGAPRQTRGVPGGRASWDARNRDRQKQGLAPLPYPPNI